MPRHARIVELPLTLAPSAAPLRHRVADAVIELLRAEALAVHLRRTRGVAASPADIILVPGASAALRALTAAANLAGRTVAFEEPGYPEGRRALRSAGAVIRYALLPETQAPAAAAVIASRVSRENLRSFPRTGRTACLPAVPVFARTDDPGEIEHHHRGVEGMPDATHIEKNCEPRP